MTFNKCIIIYFRHWRRQRRIITGNVYRSGSVRCHLVFGDSGWSWHWLLQFRLCTQAHLIFFQSRTVGGNVELPVGGPQPLAFQENAYKCTINCQELSPLLQVSCNLQDSITQEISCGLTNSTAI